MNTLTGTENALIGVWFAVTGGKWTIRPTKYGSYAVIGKDGNVIGCAHRATYGNRGWTIETAPYAGFASNNDVVEIA